MISGVDIEAWREDEKQTEFLAREKRRADNHVGWEVQALYPTGWIPCSGVHQDKKSAIDYLTFISAFWVDWEFRVYEVVKEKL